MTSSDTEDRARLRNFRIFCVLLVILLITAIWAYLPYLVVEHQRLEMWKAVGLWSGDFMGLLWFGRFVFVHAILSEPLTSVPVSEGRSHLKLIILAVVAAILIDLAFTLFIMFDERVGYDRGKVTTAEIVTIQKRNRELNTWYELNCQFTDAAGIQRETHLRVNAERHVLPATLSPELAGALNELRPGTFRVRYDQRFPQRAWIDGQGWHDGNGIYWFSILTLVFQTPVFALFLLLLAARTKGGILPWWWDVYKTLPLAAGAFWMLAMGLIDRLLDSLP